MQKRRASGQPDRPVARSQHPPARWFHELSPAGASPGSNGPIAATDSATAFTRRGLTCRLLVQQSRRSHHRRSSRGCDRSTHTPGDRLCQPSYLRLRARYAPAGVPGAPHHRHPDSRAGCRKLAHSAVCRGDRWTVPPEVTRTAVSQAFSNALSGPLPACEDDGTDAALPRVKNRIR